MLKFYYALFVCLILTAFGLTQAQQRVSGLKKVHYNSQSEVQQLRQAGAEIIVQEPEYVIIRTDGIQGTLPFEFESFTEDELVQRLVKIQLKDSDDVQKIVDTGVDLWGVKDNIATALAFDIYIEKLRQMGFTVEIISQDSRKQKLQN